MIFYNGTKANCCNLNPVDMQGCCLYGLDAMLQDRQISQNKTKPVFCKSSLGMLLL